MATTSRSKRPAKGEALPQEEAARVIQYLLGKLPPKTAGSLDTKSLQEKLSRSIDRRYREISSRLAAPAVQDEAAAGMRQSSAGLAQLLRSLGGSDSSNAVEPAKPAGKKTLPAKDTTVSVVKCRFRDNAFKPKTVSDVKLAVSITEPELISPAVYHCAAAKYVIKDLICRHIIDSIDRGAIDEKKIAALPSDIENARFDLSNLHTHIAQSAGMENIRTGGFNMALNTLTAILDRAKLDYQCIENTRSGREFVITEYDDSDPANLPDERYTIRLRYFNREQLDEERAAHDARLDSFGREVQLLWDLIEVNYHDSKPIFKVKDFDDLAKKNKGRIRDLLKRKNGVPAQEIVKEPAGVRFARMHERIKNMYEFLNPVERGLLEDRLAWLENENARLDFMVNPHHLRPGLVIDVEITSIKRRKTTLNALASVLGEFLPAVYGCFQ